MALRYFGRCLFLSNQRFISQRIPSIYVSFSSQAGIRWKPPSEILRDETPRHQIFTNRARRAVQVTFENDGGLQHLFTKTLGFHICNIRVANNRRTVFILWDCFPDKKKEAFTALTQNMRKIRNAVGKYLGARVTPRLEFRHDSFNAAQLELESAFSQLEEREDEERLRTALGTKPHPY